MYSGSPHVVSRIAVVVECRLQSRVIKPKPKPKRRLGFVLSVHKNFERISSARLIGSVCLAVVCLLVTLKGRSRPATEGAESWLATKRVVLVELVDLSGAHEIGDAAVAGGARHPSWHGVAAARALRALAT